MAGQGGPLPARPAAGQRSGVGLGVFLLAARFAGAGPRGWTELPAAVGGSLTTDADRCRCSTPTYTRTAALFPETRTTYTGQNARARRANRPARRLRGAGGGHPRAGFRRRAAARGCAGSGRQSPPAAPNCADVRRLAGMMPRSTSAGRDGPSRWTRPGAPATRFYREGRLGGGGPVPPPLPTRCTCSRR